jgi:hypothetical protein
MDPYVDFTGRVTGYAVVDVAKEMNRYQWRFAETNVWKVERMLLDYPHRRIATSNARTRRLRAWYHAFRQKHGVKPLSYRGREKWSALPNGDLASW